MRSTKTNFILNSCNQILSIIVPLITTPYITRVIGAECIGVFSYANSIVYYFTLLGMLGLANYGGREIAKARNNKVQLNKVFSGIYYSQLISSTVAVALYIVYCVLNPTVIAKVFIVSVVSVAFDINWVYYGLEKFDITLLRNFIVKFVSTILVFLFVKQPKDVYIYTIIMVASGLLGNVLLWFPLRKEIRFTVVNRKQILRHLKACMVLFIPLVLLSFYKVMDKIMLKNLSDYYQVGYYECADKLGQIPLYLISSLSQVMIPRISFNVSNNVESNSYFRKSNMFISFIATSLIFGIVSVADLFVPIYFGKGYDACIKLSRVIVPSYIFSGYANVIRSQMLIPYGKDREFTISLFAGAIVNFTLNSLLIRQYDALGAAIATAITEIIVFVVTYLYCKNKINFPEFVGDNYPFYIAGILMLFVVNTISVRLNEVALLIIKVLIGAGIYCVCLTLIFVAKRKRKYEKG